MTINLPIDEMDRWQKFVLGLQNENRFILDERIQEFIDALIKYSKKYRNHTLKEDTELFRARLHPYNSQKNDTSYRPEEMGAPPPEKARAGRLNPEGIPYLYLASDEYTAIAEIRPWKKATLTIARAKVSRDLTIVDVTDTTTSELNQDSDGFSEGNDNAKIMWELISYLFSVPQHPEDQVSYAPTQYLAEAYKKNGFDGIKYKSSLSETGCNYVLFNSDYVNIEKTENIEVTSVKYDYKK